MMTTSNIPDLGIRVMPNLILGQPIDDSKTEGGVHLPENVKGRNIPRVTIVAVGEGVDYLKVGDVIHYAPYSNEVPVMSIRGHKVIKIFPDEIIGVE